MYSELMRALEMWIRGKRDDELTSPYLAASARHFSAHFSISVNRP